MSCLMDDLQFFKNNGGEDEWIKKEKLRKAMEEAKLDNFIQSILKWEKTGEGE